MDLLESDFGPSPSRSRPGSRAGELLGRIQRTSATLSNSPGVFRCAGIIEGAVSAAKAATEARRTGQFRTPITGFKELDQKIDGGLPEIGPCIILGNTGAGKTAFANQIASQCGFPALYVTTEMTPVELFRCQMARQTNTFLGKLKSGEIPPEEIEKMAYQSAANMPNLTYVDSTIAFASPSFLLECVKRAKGDAKTLLLVIDSLHSWTRGGNTGVSEYDALNQNLLALQRLCHEIGCPALIISEQSRAAIVGGGGVNSGAGSRSIEYGAEIVFDLQAATEIDMTGEKVVKVLIAKNRHGAAGGSECRDFEQTPPLRAR